MSNERLIEEFLTLIQIDSETKYEREIADYLIKRMQGLGLHVKEDSSSRKTGHAAGNLICTLPASGKDAPPIYFTSHMDTVVPGIGVTPQVTEEWITSDGTTVLGADDKAGLAVMIEAVERLKEENISHGQVQFILTAGEESGLVGARHLDMNLVDAAYGYALDSDGEVGTIITAAPNQAKLFVTMHGKKAHAGVAPEKGVSAIKLAAEAIAAMPLGRIDEETTANIGRIDGGSQTNIVCDKVEIKAEARSLDREKLQEQVKKMEHALETAADEGGGRAEINTQLVYPGYKQSESDQVVHTAKKAAEAVGRRAVLKQSGGGSDANIIAGHGIPTVNLGVGYENIHTTEERQSIRELQTLAAYVVEIIQTA
ncbi:M20/M25/M40 family metallo-hydrolase [Alkalicoccus urumqiensis]|uniref:Peptidase M20 dimerisation domain-containing protein n=1 Tax=Alkalicoccus urumqiensis TaxID=1548213 RepID=A0A2P6MKG0_ALKUR|nr:M20/M25/M40 family metallo-hydrolase [Alkalicoccus urumqiensis]PRO66735.1 hypothetical protein C6I21_02065 [Alkalicoccus urumqiensis]